MPAHPPKCPWLYFLYLALNVYFADRREAHLDVMRCYRCNRIGHWAKDCSFGAQPPSRQPYTYNPTGLPLNSRDLAGTNPFNGGNNKETPDVPTQFDNLAKVLERDVNFEYEASATPQPCVKGNLRKNVAFWESIECKRFILDVIKCGYKLPFISNATFPAAFSNNKSAIKHAQFVSDAIQELTDTGRIVS